MEYVYYYFATIIVLIIGYMIGVHDERKNGPAACQKEMDRQIAEYYKTKDEFDKLEDSLRLIDNDVASKSISKYSHLRLV